MGANYSQEQMLGPKPHVAYCKTCKEVRLTKIEYVDNPNRWDCCICTTIIWIFFVISSLILSIRERKDANFAMLCTVVIGFGFVILCILTFPGKDIKHYCTHCEAYIGQYDPNNYRQANMMITQNQM